MSNNRLYGNLVGLEFNGKFVACETSCDFNCETDFIPASPVDAGRWEESIEGVRKWTMSVNANALVRTLTGTSLADVLNLIITGGAVTIKFKMRNASMPQFTISGNAFVSSAGITAAVNSGSTWNANFKGNGAFTIQSTIPTVYNTIYYGSSVSKPTTVTQIKALNVTNFTTEDIILNTNTNRFMTIAVPFDATLVSVYNRTAEEDVYSEYIPFTTMDIDGVSFHIYTMETAVPYSENNEHVINIT